MKIDPPKCYLYLKESNLILKIISRRVKKWKKEWEVQVYLE